MSRPRSKATARRHAAWARWRARGWTDQRIAARYGVTRQAVWKALRR